MKGRIESFILLYALFAPIRVEAAEYSILVPGLFHNGEVAAQSGETWLGLYKARDGYELVPVTISATAAYDAILDANEEDPNDQSKKTGKEIKARPTNPGFLSAEPLALIKSQALKPRKIISAQIEECSDTTNECWNGRLKFFRPMIDFAPLPKVKLLLGTRTYIMTLTVYNGGQCALSLHHNKVSQTIASSENNINVDMMNPELVITSCGDSMDEFPVIVWAGDLDGDEKLDLLLNPRRHYLMSELVLFTSQQDNNKKLVSKAAILSTWSD